MILRLLNVIDKPFKVGAERSEDDVSLFLLNEFVVQAKASHAGVEIVADIDAHSDAPDATPAERAVAKSSDGLEPSTSSVPWRFSGGNGIRAPSLAITSILQIGRSASVGSARP